jgi:hypothetical protein
MTTLLCGAAAIASDPGLGHFGIVEISERYLLGRTLE